MNTAKAKSVRSVWVLTTVCNVLFIMVIGSVPPVGGILPIVLSSGGLSIQMRDY
jgi:energy-converting hydrogenase Eha subunit H